MTTPRIEEMIRKFESMPAHTITYGEMMMVEVEDVRRNLSIILTQAHQAGFNDALQTLLDSEEMKENKIPPNTVATTDEEDAEIWGYNSAITAMREKITSLMHTKQAE